MAAIVARGAQSMNSKLLKTVLHKSYHREGSSSSNELKGVSVGLKGENEKDDYQVDGNDGSCWIPHHQTGIYYPKGHEKVMEDVPIGAANSKEVHHRFRAMMVSQIISSSQLIDLSPYL